MPQQETQTPTKTVLSPKLGGGPHGIGTLKKFLLQSETSMPINFR